jgi:hypothetical protein
MSEEELMLIEKCGRCLMTAEQVAVIMQKPLKEINQMLNTTGHIAQQRYNKGRYIAELEVRESIISMATQGSSQAQELWLKLRNELEISKA